MNAAANLLEELTAAGVCLSRRGDRLHVEAKAGTLLPAMRARLTAAKSDLLALLPASPSAPLARLLELAAAEGMSAALVLSLPDDELAECTDASDAELCAYLRALEATNLLGKGIIPPAWGTPQTRTCEGCGPVSLWASCPDVVKACPWCVGRKAGQPAAIT